MLMLFASLPFWTLGTFLFLLAISALVGLFDSRRSHNDRAVLLGVFVGMMIASGFLFVGAAQLIGAS